MKKEYPAQRGDLLILIATVYLLIPVVIFFGGFVKLIIAVPLLLFIGIIVMRYATVVFQMADTSFLLWPGLRRVFINNFLPLAILFAWLLIAGIGGFTYQNFDYVFFNATLKALIVNSWPLALQTPSGEDFYFSYYLGYFLVPALVGKLCGWFAANLASFAMAAGGVSLVFLLFRNFVENFLSRRLSSIESVFFALFMIIFGGMDVLAYINQSQISSLKGGGHIEWWNGMFQYSSNSVLMFWVPQQAIATWVVTGIVMNCKSKVALRNLGLSLSSLILYSPFGAIGVGLILIVFLAVAYWKSFRSLLSLPNLVLAPVIAFILGSYIMSNSFSFPIRVAFEYSHFFSTYIRFVLIEFLFWTPLFWVAYRNTPVFTSSYRTLIVSSFAILLVVPMIMMGYSNDFCMRVSIAPLGMLSCFAFTAVSLVYSTHGEFGLKTKLVTGALLLFISMNFVQESIRALKMHYRPNSVPMSHVPDYLELPVEQETLDQRKGDPTKFYYVYLSKVPVKAKSEE